MDELVEALDGIPDERLRLIFTCCHPALAPEAQVALTLRLVCGLSTPEIARAFLVQEATMAARITRAKRKIRVANIPYRVPEGDELPPGSSRCSPSCTSSSRRGTRHHRASTSSVSISPSAAWSSRGCCARCSRPIRRSRACSRWCSSPMHAAPLASMRPVASCCSSDQDRTRWDRTAIAEGAALVAEALRPNPPGRFALMAAIAAVHDESPTWEDTDWAAILAIYDVLRIAWPTPVVELNRAIALGFADGAEAGLAELDGLAGDPRLARYPYLAAARADSLARLGRPAEARIAYDEALILTDNEVEREFLAARIRSLDER